MTRPGNRLPRHAERAIAASGRDVRPWQRHDGGGTSDGAGTSDGVGGVGGDDGDGRGAEAKATAAERARTVVAGLSSATLVVPGLTVPDPLAMLPSQRAVTADGDIILRLPPGSPAVRAVRHAEGDEVVAVLEITDVAPVAVASRVRGRVSIAGWLTPARGTRGEGWLRLEVGEVSVDDVWGTELVEPDDFANAEPDPLAGYEAELLQHLAAAHSDELRGLCAMVDIRPSRTLRDVVPVALDRFGLRIRIGEGGSVFDVRFQFPTPVATVAELRRTIHALFAESWRVVYQDRDQNRDQDPDLV